MSIKLPALPLKLWIQMLIVTTLVVYMASQYLLNYRYIQQLNNDQVGRLNTLISSNLQTMIRFPLATNDIPAIVSITDDLMKNDIIWAIEVRDDENRILERRERPHSNEPITLERKIISILDERPPLQIDETLSATGDSPVLIGKVFIYFSNDAQVSALNSELQINSLIFTVITLLLTFLVASMFVNISRAVNQTNTEMQKIIDGNFDIRIPRTRVREFNTLASKLEEVATTINHQVDELKISQVRARKKQEEAEESNASQIKFMQIISHEIRSPVHVLVNTMKTIANDVEKQRAPKLKKLFSLMKCSADELQSAIDEMLDVQAFETGQVRLKYSEQTINSTVLDVCARFKQRMTIKHLNYEYQDQVPVCNYKASFDKGKVERVLVNLLENAYKYTHKGVISVTWNVESKDGGHHLVLQVMDSGIGISAEDQDKIFNRFFQVKAPSVRQQNGRGIGLSIVKELVTLMKGVINVDSTLRRGSTFTVSIPITISEQVLQEWGGSDSFLDSECEVLVIDDKEANCLVMMEMLKESGITPDYATDPNTGLNKALRKHYDVILVDYHMPDLDGAALTKTIRESEVNALSVIMCVTADITIDAQKAIQENNHFNGTIIKPFNAEELCERIEHALYSKQQGGKVVYGFFKTPNE